MIMIGILYRHHQPGTDTTRPSAAPTIARPTPPAPAAVPRGRSTPRRAGTPPSEYAADRRPDPPHPACLDYSRQGVRPARAKSPGIAGCCTSIGSMYWRCPGGRTPRCTLQRRGSSCRFAFQILSCGIRYRQYTASGIAGSPRTGTGCDVVRVCVSRGDVRPPGKNRVLVTVAILARPGPLFSSTSGCTTPSTPAVRRPPVRCQSGAGGHGPEFIRNGQPRPEKQPDRVAAGLLYRSLYGPAS